MAAMDRWIFHLLEKHPDAEAPCLAYVEAAQQRLHERREQAYPSPEAPGAPKALSAPASTVTA